MKVLLVGLGSIASKHLKALREIDSAASVFALRHKQPASEIENIQNIYDTSEIPRDIDFIIIANPTSEHQKTLENLLFLRVPFIIEKPLFSDLNAKQSLLNQIIETNLITYVACNMRFHPSINFLKAKIEQEKPLEMNVYCGSYLPDWRPGTDYRKNYSAIKVLGGGVDLDLIHEIDYTLYLMGKPQEHKRYVRRKSNLEIDSSDIAHYVLEYDKSSAFITLNYYRKVAKRTIEIVWEDSIWQVDLLKSTILDEHDEVIFEKEFQMQDTYIQQLSYFINCLKTGEKPMNDVHEAYETLKLTLNE